MLELARLPLIVTFPLISRSPVAASSSLAPTIVNWIVPFGSRIVSEFGLELAASIADRKEIWPDASFPVFKFTASVSSSVLTLKVERTRRSLQRSPHGRNRARRLASRVRIRAADAEIPFSENSRRNGFMASLPDCDELDGKRLSSCSAKTGARTTDGFNFFWEVAG